MGPLEEQQVLLTASSPSFLDTLGQFLRTKLLSGYRFVQILLFMLLFCCERLSGLPQAPHTAEVDLKLLTLRHLHSKYWDYRQKLPVRGGFLFCFVLIL